MTHVDDTLPPGPTVCHHCRKPLGCATVYLDDKSGPLHPECLTAIAHRRMRAKEKRPRSWLAQWLKNILGG